jgi:UPF0716 protein FxsA
MVKWIIAAVLLLPVAEIATFVVVTLFIGFGWALALLLATTIAGFLVLRRAGRGRLARFRATVAESDIASFEANTAGFLTVLAGILLFLPGFLTDLAGALVLLRPVRRRCAAALRQAVMGSARTGGRGSLVDLAPDEWKQEPDRGPRREPDKSNRN